MDFPVLIGLIALALSALGLWIGLERFWARHGRPDIRTEPLKRALKLTGPDAEARAVRFRQPLDSRWLVYEIGTDSQQDRWLAVLQGARRSGPWTDRISYHPPVSSASFLLHPDAPASLRVSFRARLQSYSRILCKVDVILSSAASPAESRRQRDPAA